MKNFFLGLIRIYQQMISPWLGNHCRFHPSCSQYGFEVIEKQGFIQGVRRLSMRLLKCHPLHPGGWDPVERP